MKWSDYIDGYCERVMPGFWAEPLNALTNVFFLVAAFLMWRRVRGQTLPLAETFCAILALISIGSFLFHTLASVWASTADSLPILLFVLVYIFAMNRHVLGWGLWMAVAGMMGFIPYAAGITALTGDLPFFRISNFYWSVPLLVFFYSGVLWNGHRDTAMGLALGGVALVVSITLRSLDMQVCDLLPVGTHFLWHSLNAVLLAWMIEVYRRHHLSGGLAGTAVGR